MSSNKLYASTLVLLLVLAGCGTSSQPPRQGPPPVNVTVTTATPAYAPYFDEYAGVVKALQEVELRAQVSGYISGIHFTEGDKVKKGDLLYTIDSQPFQAAYQQAVANLAVQESNFDKAKKDLDRYQELAAKEAISKQQLDYAEAAYTAAKEQVTAAKSAVTNVQTNVKYSKITAPFDGTIGISMVRLGASVSPGSTLLNTLSSDDPMMIEVAVDQREIGRYSKLLSGKTKTVDSTFQLRVNKTVYSQVGKLSFIDRAVDPLTGTIKIRVQFPNPDFELRAGMSATLRVLSNTNQKSITVPYKAITEQLGEFFVYVADSNKVSQRNVKLGKQIGTNVIIEQGLKGGEVVVVQGVQNLRQGSAINIPEAAPKSN